MSDTPSNDGRKTDGRFAAGNKASPGKPKGTRHRATVMAEKLLGKDASQIIKRLVTAAKNGEPWAIKFVAERLLPPARPMSALTSPIDLEPPKSAQEARDAIARITSMIARCEIDGEHGARTIAGLEAFLNARAAELEAEVERHRAEEERGL